MTLNKQNWFQEIIMFNPYIAASWWLAVLFTDWTIYLGLFILRHFRRFSYEEMVPAHLCFCLLQTGNNLLKKLLLIPTSSVFIWSEWKKVDWCMPYKWKDYLCILASRLNLQLLSFSQGTSELRFALFLCKSSQFPCSCSPKILCFFLKAILYWNDGASIY